MGILRLTLCALVPALALCQPIIDVAPDTLDFGRTAPRQFVVGEFHVYNRGADTLKLNDVETSCGCTVATPDASRVAFMETMTVRVSMNIEKRSGRFTQWVRLKTNDPKTPQRDVYITADIQPSADSVK